jgi:methionyl aminopeptidase
MHEPPHIANFGRPGVGHKLKAGMVVALEPMFALGKPGTKELADRWTVRMRDGSLCAHFEETVAITEDGPEVLTRMR